MSPTQDQYRELVALTQLYLFQEHTVSDRVFDAPETFEYFLKQAQKKNVNTVPEQKQTPPSTNPPQSTYIPKASPSPTISKTNVSTATQEINLPVSSQASPKPIPEQKKPEAIKIETVVAPVTSSPNKKTFFTIETPPPPKDVEMSDLKKIINEQLPHLQLIGQVPDDGEARHLPTLKQEAQRNADIILITLNEPPEHALFLSNIGKALEVYGFSIKTVSGITIEREKGWNTLLESSGLKLVIANNGSLYTLSEMQKHHKETQKPARHYLGKHPLLLLSDLSFYLKEPALKSSLWHAIRELLS
ncbi:MAG: hypothetical protein WCG42_04130 [Parachlamydiaceae bacterium]